MKIYNINYTKEKPALLGKWSSDEWKNSEIAELQSIRPESSDFIPLVQVKLLYNNEGISGIFYVEDKYVKRSRTTHMDPVWNDSCVEFFVKPIPGKGYFNFEFNCIGVLYASYVSNPERTDDGFKEFTMFSKEECGKVEIVSSLKESIEPEYKESLIWTLQFFIPFSLIEIFAGKLDLEKKNEWSCNFYKCADESSHPHWISWAPIRELNFHSPESFGKLFFEKSR